MSALWPWMVEIIPQEEAVFCLGITYAGNGFACDLVYVYIRAGLDLASNYHQAGGAEGLARDFRLRILAEELI